MCGVALAMSARLLAAINNAHDYAETGSSRACALNIVHVRALDNLGNVMCPEVAHLTRHQNHRTANVGCPSTA